MITVLLADDHPFTRNALRSLLQAADDIQIVAMASNGEEAVAQAILHCPDVVVMDISMPLLDGIEATKQICAKCPDTHVMIFSMFDNPKYIYRSLDVGAFGYVLKDAMGNDVVAAIRTLHKGNRYFSQHIAGIATQYIRHRRNDTWAG
jgi:DNA-binding NarL/FixJ family response regulator